MDRYALYMRTSTPTQQEAETIDIQRHILNDYAQKNNLVVHSHYEDDAVTSGIPLFQRPQGARLLADIIQGVVTHVLTYSTDRLFRDVEDAWSGYKLFIKHKITVQTPVETINFSTAIGRLQTGLKAVLDEYEKHAIAERMANGRAHSARKGKYVYGVVPFGFDVNANGFLVHSQRTIHGQTEADIARGIFENIANGSSLEAEAKRLTLLGIPSVKRYINGNESSPAKEWHQTRLSYMIKRSVYYTGRHTLHTAQGDIDRHVEPLITQAVFDAANVQVAKNRTLPKGNQKRLYLLRGLLWCTNCGLRYTGAHDNGYAYYRCGSQTRSNRCIAKRLRAETLEEFIWQCCIEWIRNSEEHLGRAYAKLQSRQAQTSTNDTERQQWQQALHEKSLEKERMLRLYKRGSIELEEYEREIAATDQEAAAIRSALARLESHRDGTAALEARVMDQAELLVSLQAHLDTITTPDQQRAIIERLVAGIDVLTTGTGYHKTADLKVRFFLGEKHAALSSIIRHGDRRSTGAGLHPSCARSSGYRGSHAPTRSAGLAPCRACVTACWGAPGTVTNRRRWF